MAKLVSNEPSFEQCVELAESMVCSAELMEDERLTFFYKSSLDLYKDATAINEDNGLLIRLMICIKKAERVIINRYTETYSCLYDALDDIWEKYIIIREEKENN